MLEDIMMKVFYFATIIVLIFLTGVITWIGYMGIDYGVQRCKANYIVSDGENTYFIDEIVHNDGNIYTMTTTKGHTLTIKPLTIEKNK